MLFQGQIYLQSDSSLPPFTAPLIAEFVEHTDKMAYVYVTEYVANSGWYAALNAGRLQITVHENTVSLIVF